MGFEKDCRRPSSSSPRIETVDKPKSHTLNQVSGHGGGFDRSMQHHLMDVLFKDGVYDPRKMGETFA